MRKDFDFYPTPITIVNEVIKRWEIPDSKVWEPCAGDGRFARSLTEIGCDVVSTDIIHHQDFFSYSSALAPVVITNPPFSNIRKFIGHAFNIGVEKMALVCPERLWACKKGRDQFNQHKPTRWANMDWREDYLQKGGSPDRALAVAIWDMPNSPVCSYEIWNRSD
jgi:hypothetical protein|tara:strand:- start:196 stop:690 length:495 start_codon:yes stop_codon:yes gene_type:complete